MPKQAELSFNGAFWLALSTWIAAGFLALLATMLMASWLRKRVHLPPEAVVVVGAVTVASYIDLEFGAWIAGVLGLCALGVGVCEYMTGRNLEQGTAKHESKEQWAAHFRFDGTCPCADKTTPKQPGDRGAIRPAAAGLPTSPLGLATSTSRGGDALRVDDPGRPEDTRPAVVDERPTPHMSVDALAAVRHHVSGLAVSCSPAGNVVPPPRRTPAPVVHVTGAVEELAEAG